MDDNVKDFVVLVAEAVKKAGAGLDVSKEVARVNYWILKNYPEAYNIVDKKNS